MSTQVTVNQHWSDTKRLRAIGSVALVGNYSTGGDTVNFGDPLIKSASPPQTVDFRNQTKYKLMFIAGTTLQTGKIKIIIPDTGLELAAGAYPGALTADVITFDGIFKKFR